MGACASFPKTLGDAAHKAPAPEQPIEETAEAVVESNEQVKEETAAPVVVPAPSAAEVNEKNTDAAAPPAEAKKE